MRQFQDAKDRKWELSLNIAAVKRCRDLLGVDLLEPEKGNPPLLTLLGTDEIMLCDIVFCLVKNQADERSITDEQFGESLGGEALALASDALYEELIDFFQSRGRTDRAKAVLRQKQTLEKAIAKVEMEIDNIDLDSHLDTAFGSGSIDLQASQALTPTPEPSGN